MWPHRCWVQRKHHFPPPAVDALPNAVENTVSCLCRESTLLGHGQRLVLQDHWWPSLQSCFPGSQFPACTGAQASSSPDAGLCFSFHWSSFQPSSPDAPGSSEWQHNPLVCQIFLQFSLGNGTQVCSIKYVQNNNIKTNQPKTRQNKQTKKTQLQKNKQKTNITPAWCTTQSIRWYEMSLHQQYPSCFL